MTPWFVLQMTLIACSALLCIGQKRRRYFFPRIAASACAAFAAMWFFPQVDVFGISLGFFVAFVLTVVVVFVSYDMKLSQAVFVVSVSYALQNCAFNVHQILSSLLPLFPNSAYILTAALTLLFGTGYYFVFMRRIIREDDIGKGRGRLLAVSGATLFIVYILGGLLAYFEHGVGVDIVCRVLLIICCLFAMLIQSGVFRESRLQKEKDMFKHLLQMEREQYRTAKENIELIDLKCHDLKHQISALRTIESEQKRNDYLDRIERAVMIYDSVAKTGNEALDVVLTEKSLICEKNSIKFTYMVDSDKLSFMDTIDVCTLFGNALDNAIESVLGVRDPEKRIVSFSVRSNGKLLRIRMENYFEGTVIFRGGLPVSSKGGGMHGFGMRSMRLIAEKYGGVLSVLCEKNSFILNIIIPLV